MKIINIKVLCILMIGILSLQSCHHDNPNEDKFENDPTSGWINFSTQSTQITDDVSSINIPLTQNSAVNSENTEVTVLVESIEGTVPESVLGNYTAVINENMLDGELTIPVEQTNDRYTVQITIIESNKGNLQIGLDEETSNIYPITHTLTVCDATIDNEATYAGSSFIEGDLTSQFEINLSEVEGENNTYLLSTAWGENFVADATGQPLQGQYLYEAILYVNQDNSVTVEATDPNNTGFFQGGSGSYDACTKTFSYSLEQSLFSNDFLVDVTLVAQ
ncbi:hypothetical protein [Mesonia mobilis]|uniref:hypothetical protein n=1 Tax=Mesonia mobilis TaxID=369791 RepID=UPI0026E957FE|nr:hypothetical protein [Mesonia mobilis]